MYRCFEEKMHLKANLLQKNFPANAFRLQCSDFLTSYKQLTWAKYIPGQTSIKSASAETEIKEEKKIIFKIISELISSQLYTRIWAQTDEFGWMI